VAVRVSNTHLSYGKDVSIANQIWWLPRSAKRRENTAQKGMVEIVGIRTNRVVIVRSEACFGVKCPYEKFLSGR
jgi:hypothetical protein